MLTVRIICVGRLKEKYFISAASEYEKRLRPFCKLEITELSEKTGPRKLREEAESVNAALLPSSATCALCIEGEMLSSEELAAWVNGVSFGGISRINFIIGSSDGLDAEIKKNADKALSFSRMTFPHHFARIMLLEQLYRAFQINNGGKYHK